MLSIYSARTFTHLFVALLLMLAIVLTLSGSALFASPQSTPAHSGLLAADDFTNDIKLPIVGPVKI